jgi:hypothetical protein
MGNNIVLAEEKKEIETYNLSDREMIIFVDDPRIFELGTKYKLRVEIQDAKTTGDSLNDAYLIPVG